jgi:hypothetical protein
MPIIPYVFQGMNSGKSKLLDHDMENVMKTRKNKK